MAFDIQVTNPQRHANVTAHRIVPVRFARAVSGFAAEDAPDIDDHGFTIPQDFCQAHGPVVGMAQTKTIRVRVVRDRIEPTTQLFPTIDDSSVAILEHPTPGSALNPNDSDGQIGDCVYLNGAATGSSDAETKLKIHYGSVDGPILAELAVRVYPEIVIRVQAHAVTINGTASATDITAARSIFNRVNRIYAQAGVRFSLASTIAIESITGFARAGTVTLTNVADQQNVELQSVLRLNPVANRLNAYFFAHFHDTVSGATDDVLGVAFSRDDANANPANAATGFPGCQAGITFRDNTDIAQVSATVAHEIGHSLRLSHYAVRNGAAVIADIWAQRCLMFNFSSLSSTAARNNVGYGRHANGNVRRGQLLMTKKLQHLRQSDQINVLRRAARSRSFAPI